MNMETNINSLREFMKFLLREEAQLTSKAFDLQKFKSLEDYHEIVSYVKENLEELASGAARRTYIIDDKTILKLVRGAGWNYQNKNEVQHATCLGKSHAPIIFDYDSKNYYWIIEERLQPISDKELFNKLESLIHHRFKDWFDLKSFFATINIQNYDPLFAELYEGSEWLRKLVDELQKCEVSTQDFHDENWGVRPETGELVLLDLGF
jgi:hypothetical protein